MPCNLDCDNEHSSSRAHFHCVCGQVLQRKPSLLHHLQWGKQHKKANSHKDKFSSAAYANTISVAPTSSKTHTVDTSCRPTTFTGSSHTSGSTNVATSTTCQTVTVDTCSASMSNTQTTTSTGDQVPSVHPASKLRQAQCPHCSLVMTRHNLSRHIRNVHGAKQAWGDYMSNVIDYDYDYLLAV